jgi:hypothetical protein
MKSKILIPVLFAGTITLGLASCKKTSDATDSSAIESTFELSGDQAIADNLTEDTYDVMSEAVETQGLGGAGRVEPVTNNNLLCASVTVAPLNGFPKTITIDFGTGCTPPGSTITRRGKVIVTLSDTLRRPGSTAVTTFDNYYINNFKKEGTITWTNTSTPGTRSWHRQVQNGKITAPDGRFWLHTSEKEITQVEGAATPHVLIDDAFTVTGTGSVTNSNNVTRTSTILQALHKRVACENIDAGVIQFQGPNHTATLNFGDGTCDRLATISIDGQQPRTILLRN